MEKNQPPNDEENRGSQERSPGGYYPHGRKIRKLSNVTLSGSEPPQGGPADDGGAGDMAPTPNIIPMPPPQQRSSISGPSGSRQSEGQKGDEKKGGAKDKE